MPQNTSVTIVWRITSFTMRNTIKHFRMRREDDSRRTNRTHRVGALPQSHPVLCGTLMGPTKDTHGTPVPLRREAVGPETQSTRHHPNDKTKVITPRFGYQQFPSSLHYLLSPLPCSLPHDHRRDTPETPKPQTTSPKMQACDLILILNIRLFSSFRLIW